MGKGPNYWERRQHFKYYTEVQRLAKAYAPSGRQVIDVGALGADFLCRLEWFERRVALDRRAMPQRQGIETVTTDFMTYQPEGHFDLVLCLQVLEHLEEPGVFARRLLDVGRTVIISVPYKWPKEYCKYHVQDPVDEAKLESWTQREPIETIIVEDEGQKRLIAVYQE
jgi:hypothetical protein